jgi:hypothetical protein
MGGVVGKNLSYTVPCCGVQLPDGHYGPSCWTNPNTTQAWASDTIVQTFDSSEAMDDYIGGDDYGWLDTVRPIQFGVVIDRDPVNTNQWTYSLRTNSSDVPWTGTVLNTLVSNYSRSDFFTYYDNHVLTFQWILEQYMIVRTVLPQSERVSMIENLKTQILSHTREKVKPTFAFGPSAPIFSWNAPGLPLYDLGFAPFPTPAHKQDNFEQYVGKFIGLFLVVAFMWPFSRMVRNMVEEKERKLSEGMKMMGLRNSVFWMSWVVAYLISFAIVCLLVIGASKGSLFKYSDAGLLFMFFFSFCLSLISLACLVTTFFSRAKTAGTLSPFLLLVGYLPYFSVSDPDKAQGVKVMACLMSPVAISLGSTQIISYEGVFIGSHWNNASDVIDNFTLSSAIAMMLFDAFLYAVIAWYLDKVWPREYGTHLKWYFLVTPSYWKSCCSCRRTRTQRQPVEDDPLFGGEGIDSPRPGLKGISVTTASPARPAFNSHARIASYGSATPVRYGTPLLQADDEVDPDFGPDYEAVPEAMRSRIGVKIRGLRKTFKRDGNEVAAVKGLDLNLYQGQITCLLGHNGAGSVRCSIESRAVWGANRHV